jgi:tetratricopeptide (TPR) repeat protein
MRKLSVDVASAFGRALVLHRAGQLAEAKEMYRRIAKIDPAHFESRHLLGVVCHQLGDHAAALRAIDDTLKIHPRLASAHVNRGVVLQHLKHLEEALASYERAIAIEPTDVVSFYNRGNVLKEMKAARGGRGELLSRRRARPRTLGGLLQPRQCAEGTESIRSGAGEL